MKILENLWVKAKEWTLWLLDFLVPSSKRAKEIAAITPEEFLDKVKSAPPLLIPKTKVLFSYKDPLVKDTIWLLKYRRNKRAGEILGALLANITLEWLGDLELFENFVNPLLIPVPMGKDRLKERLKNHTETLCEEMMRVMPIGVVTYETEALSKIKETKNQSHTKNRAERLRNLSRSFSADSKIVRDRNIILIDDVITTGATAEEIRKTLLNAGARSVIALAIAH